MLYLSDAVLLQFLDYNSFNHSTRSFGQSSAFLYFCRDDGVLFFGWALIWPIGVAVGGTAPSLIRLLIMPFIIRATCSVQLRIYFPSQKWVDNAHFPLWRTFSHFDFQLPYYTLTPSIGIYLLQYLWLLKFSSNTWIQQRWSS